ncbi:hypothetical protein HYH03_018629 [Edaphochlamys debaryana]|nr:hypothetical protein HYH03_018629 [Edaphochlamys debaryana]|eukprot:KAG2482425.1 hypothetical protein HYH03_018629 [Edaphochlamys debaryana]
MGVDRCQTSKAAKDLKIFAKSASNPPGMMLYPGAALNGVKALLCSDAVRHSYAVALELCTGLRIATGPNTASPAKQALNDAGHTLDFALDILTRPTMLLLAFC